MPNLDTPRLRIQSYTPDLLNAAMNDRARFAELLGVRVPADWPGEDYEEIMPGIAEHMGGDPRLGDWLGLIIRKVDRTLIGGCDFMSLPDAEGTVEIGYGLQPGYRGQGYATEAVQAMVDWAFNQPGVQRIVAGCAEDNIASARVLDKMGMKRLSTKDGLISWELTR